MKAVLTLFGKRFEVNLKDGIDISIPLSPQGPRAWYVEPVIIDPVRTERFTGSVAEGGAVNFRNIHFNPHGHGTHTETVGHINKEVLSINQTLVEFFFAAALITVNPEPLQQKEGIQSDKVISADMLEGKIPDRTEALVIRTLPNSAEKLSRNYSNTNPPYFLPDALDYIRQCGVKHLLTDLPSVDREVDGGLLLSHRAFWHGGRADDMDCTITEMVYVAKNIADGIYLLNLQIAPFENDASPSKPVLFALKRILE